MMDLLPFILAKATAAEVFKSVQDSVGDDSIKTSGTTFFAVLLGAIALILLLSLSNVKYKREAKPKILNHMGKLLKEMRRRTSLRPVEMKQLKLLATHSSENDGPKVQNPLVLVLCPSVLAKTLKKPPVKLDRKVIAQVAKKMGIAIVKPRG